MQTTETIVQTLILSSIVGGLLVFCIAYVLYHNNKKQFMLRATYEKEVIKAEMEIQESTFLHVSQEIHDNIAQSIILAKYQLSAHPSSIAQMETMINEVDDTLTNTLTEIRNLSKDLNSNFITENGLWHSVQNHIEHIKKKGRITAEINEEGTARSIDPRTEIMLFRIVQESITNILKHSQADRITITFNFKQDTLELSIHDNGIGFKVDETLSHTYKRGSSGLQNIIKRAGMINASHRIISNKDKGTLLCITTPC